jgi:hypothetical protein
MARAKRFFARAPIGYIIILAGAQELRCKLEPDPTHPQYIFTEIGVGSPFKVQKCDEHEDQFKPMTRYEED